MSYPFVPRVRLPAFRLRENCQRQQTLVLDQLQSNPGRSTRCGVLRAQEGELANHEYLMAGTKLISHSCFSHAFAEWVSQNKRLGVGRCSDFGQRRVRKGSCRKLIRQGPSLYSQGRQGQSRQAIVWDPRF